jgi:Cu-Zn family superoxide dismutase
MKPFACANIIGNETEPKLNGIAYFYATNSSGVWIEVEVNDLPIKGMANYSRFYGMHIHEVGNCTPPFDQTGGHFNPTNGDHPNHAGDLPPLLNSDGYAYLMFYTSHLNSEEIINKSLVIHNMADDFRSQPSGNSGEKMACGVIVACPAEQPSYEQPLYEQKGYSQSVFY